MQHKTQKCLFKTYKAVIQCICNQFQTAINEDYLAKLNNPHVGLANVQAIDIYNHTFDQNAKTNLKMAEEDHKIFNKPIDPAKQLTMYTKKRKSAKH